MATTVNGAFSEFLSNTVNLYDADTTKARSSRDYLRFIFIAPMLSWLLSLLNDLREDNDRLKELDEEINSVVAKQMDDLQVIEKALTEHRKSAVKIPDLIYNCFKDNDEDKEHRIVELEIGS